MTNDKTDFYISDFWQFFLVYVTTYMRDDGGAHQAGNATEDRPRGCSVPMMLATMARLVVVLTCTYFAYLLEVYPNCIKKNSAELAKL